MEVIEDGNIMDRIPILLSRDFEYYEKNQTVLLESVCAGVVGGRLDFPRSASFAAVKIVLWLEEEFSIAFHQGSGMFVKLEDEVVDVGVVKTSDPDKFVQLAIKSTDMLLEHLHVLTQEALDHADLSVLTATLGAAALLKNSLHQYVQHLEDSGNAERHSLLQACYKRYVTMSEAVGERVLDLHTRVLSLYVIQDSGGRPIDDVTLKVAEAGSPSVQGWWLYMQGSRKDLWDTVPPRMAQRIFAGMLNETLTILNVRYCQTQTSGARTRLLINDILNILLCVAQMLPSICASGSDLAGFDEKQQTRDVRDVHAKCNELFKCVVYRGAELHFIHQAFVGEDESESIEPPKKDRPAPWFTFVSPHLFENFDDSTVHSTQDLPTKTAIGLDLHVLLAQPQPSWNLLIKVLAQRDCYLARYLLTRAVRHAAPGPRWPAAARWLAAPRARHCRGFLCTADGFCLFQRDDDAGVEYSRVAGALTYVLASIASKAELKSTLIYALEISGQDWSSCLDKRQVWCDRRPSWLAGILGLVSTALQFIPPILVNAIQTGASMYQTMSLCLTCLSRSLPCLPSALSRAATLLERALPPRAAPVGGCVLLQLLITVAYEELLMWAEKELAREKAATASANGDTNIINSKSGHTKPKQVRIASMGQTASSVTSDTSSASSVALAIAEALCSLDEGHKHAQEIERFVAAAGGAGGTGGAPAGLDDFPEFTGFVEEGSVPCSNAERASDAATLTSQILMTSPGRDSLRVIFDHVRLHSESIFKELNIQQSSEHAEDASIPLNNAPLLYTMFHIGRHPFDQYLRNEWPMPWSKLVATAKSLSGVNGARVHVTRRSDFRSAKQSKPVDKIMQELIDVFKNTAQGVL